MSNLREKLATAALALAIVTAPLVSFAAPTPRSHPVTQAQAEAAALKKEPGKLVGKTTMKNGQYVIQIQTTANGVHEVIVDANTGNIVSDKALPKQSSATPSSHKRK